MKELFVLWVETGLLHIVTSSCVYYEVTLKKNRIVQFTDHKHQICLTYILQSKQFHFDQKCTLFCSSNRWKSVDFSVTQKSKL